MSNITEQAFGTYTHCSPKRSIEQEVRTMPAVRTCGVGDYEFTMFFITGSEVEDGIIVPASQELTPDYVRALEQARIAYKYKQAEIMLSYDGGYWLENADIQATVAIIREGQRLGMLEPNEHTEHEILMLTDTRYRSDALRKARANDKAQPKQRKQETGHVYLIKSSEGYYKIGRSKNVQQRISTLGVQLPFDIEVLHTIKSDDYRLLETELHELFAPKWVRGEWFALSPDDIEYIKGL